MTQKITPRYMHIAGAAMIALDQGTTDTLLLTESGLLTRLQEAADRVVTGMKNETTRVM